MAELTFPQAIGDFFLSDPTSTAYTNVRFALDCQQENAYTYTTGSIPGLWDIAGTRNGEITVSGTWQATTTNPGVGTSSLVVPGSGYIRMNNVTTDYSQNSFGCWVRLSLLPSATQTFFGASSSTTNPDTNIYSLRLRLTDSGAFSVLLSYNNTLWTYTTTSTITVNTWHYLTLTYHDGLAFLGIDGNVEQFYQYITPASRQTAYYPLVLGSSVMNEAGLQLDDLLLIRQFNPKWSKTFTPPTQDLSVYYESVKSYPYKTEGSYSDRNVLPVLTQYNAVEPTFDFSNIPFYIGSINSDVSIASAALALATRNILGIQTTPSNTILRNDEKTGGGSVRPTSGFLYPRGL